MAIFLIFIMTGGIACAQDTGENPMPGAHHFDITMAHGAGTKYIKFDGGGLNALHITSNPDDPYGQVTTTEESFGEFFLSETGGRGFFDDMILMVAVKGEIPDDFSLSIRASGYQWTPTAVLNMPPSVDDITYVEGSIDDTFTKDDFIYGPQDWKPAGNNDPMNYPIYFEQDMSDPSNEFNIMFIDLNAGLLGPNSCLTGLNDNGMIRLEYSIDNPGAMVAFNIYGWCNQSNQGRGISWTNRVAGDGSSGYQVMGSSGQGGDSGQSGSVGYSMDYEAGGETAEDSGQQDGEFLVLEKVVVNGTIKILSTQERSRTLFKGQSLDFAFDLPAADSIELGRLYVFTRDGKNQGSAKGTDVDLSVKWDGVALSPAAYYNSKQMKSGSPIAGTYCFNVTGLARPSHHHSITVILDGPQSSVVSVDGLALVIAYADESAGRASCWIGEGSLVVAPNEGESTINFPFPGDIGLYPWNDAVLSVVSTQSAGESKVAGSVRLNEGPWEAIRDGGSPISVSCHDLTPDIEWKYNIVSVQPPPGDGDGLPLELRGMILAVSHPPEAGPVPESENISVRYEPSPTGQEESTYMASTTPTQAKPEKSVTTIPVAEEADNSQDSGIGGFIDGIVRMIFEILVGPDQSATVLYSQPSDTVTGAVDTYEELPVMTQDAGTKISPGIVSGKSGFMLTISSYPTGAEIMMDGSELNVTTPHSVTGLDPGNYTITLRKDMFQTIDVPVMVENDTLLDVLLLPALPDTADISPVFLKDSEGEAGGIYVDSYPRGAEISIDGKKSREITPAVISNLRPGYHSIKVEKGTTPYAVKTRTVTVLPGIISRSFFSIEPLRITSVRIESDTYDGMEFTVNGRQPIYKLPKKVTVEGVGSYITIKDGGDYISKALSDYIQVGETVTLGQEEVDMASVKVTSTPAGADVLFDGFPTDLKTPCRFGSISPGKHQVLVSMPGYIPEEKEFYVVDDPTLEDDATVSLQLVPYVYGAVSVESKPEGARIYIDERNSGYVTPHTFIYLPIGSYSLEIESGDSSKFFDIDVSPGEEIRITVDFENGTFTKGTG